MKQRFNVALTSKHYQTLVRRMNYLGSNRTSTILLSLFLYQDSELSEEHVRTQLENVTADLDKEEFYFQGLTYIVDIFKHKKLFLYSLDKYVTAFLNELLEKEDAHWKEANQKQKKFTCIYSVDKGLADWLVQFSSETGISQTTLVNYSLMHAIPPERLVSRTGEKQDKGFYLTRTNFDKINAEKEFERAMVLENHIKALQTLAE